MGASSNFEGVLVSLVHLLFTWYDKGRALQAPRRFRILHVPTAHLQEAVLDSIHTTIYIALMLSACALFSKTRIEISGSGPRNDTNQLKNQRMVMVGHRESSTYKELKRVIPTADAFGGAILGLFSVAADLVLILGDRHARIGRA
ncbi:hypothetical protein CVT25_002242 [Psilocybe cyanescens]|uniref:Uncharacterized protein n=1 Tax=Psilocybe cyanescens TaxID=93625 RepID=A0A409X5Q2_PSICY|nr:hypothetical protein CVT25_002242 [Psilocybe cyanescens]